MASGAILHEDRFAAIVFRVDLKRRELLRIVVDDLLPVGVDRRGKYFRESRGR